MKLAGKIIIALIVAAVAVALRHFIPAVPEAAMLVIACLATAVLVSLPATESSSRQPPRANPPTGREKVAR